MVLLSPLLELQHPLLMERVQHPDFLFMLEAQQNLFNSRFQIPIQHIMNDDFLTRTISLTSTGSV